ncbi:hypothetical protein OH784_13780 [Ectobacillus funiculus]|uniref:hypothetical protein n=1 Tax=Ectobacillus funiculus TaxID=137993 RepID=UPI0039799022
MNGPLSELIEEEVRKVVKDIIKIFLEHETINAAKKAKLMDRFNLSHEEFSELERMSNKSNQENEGGA